MGDPVRVALRAAVEAFQAKNGHDPEYDDTPEVAAAIAAFLRALPSPLQFPVPEARPAWMPPEKPVVQFIVGHHNLAAAVEAAGEARDE